jgi:hypothetical protein
MTAIEVARAALAAVEAHPWLDDRTCSWLRVDRADLQMTRNALRALIAEHQELFDEKESLRIDNLGHALGHTQAMMRAASAKDSAMWSQTRAVVDELRLHAVGESHLDEDGLSDLCSSAADEIESLWDWVEVLECAAVFSRGGTDAQVDAAAKAMYAMTNSLSMSGARDLARAALEAARVSS